jgi:hypothetical protein
MRAAGTQLAPVATEAVILTLDRAGEIQSGEGAPATEAEKEAFAELQARLAPQFAAMAAALGRSLEGVDLVAASELIERVGRDPRVRRKYGHAPIRHAPAILRALDGQNGFDQSHPVARARESRPGRRTRSSRASRDGPDEPEPPLGGPTRSCGLCGASLEGRRSNVRYCSDSHKVRACQLRSDERRAREVRLTAALEIVGELGLDERPLLLAAVVWPVDGRLLQVAA